MNTSTNQPPELPVAVAQTNTVPVKTNAAEAVVTVTTSEPPAIAKAGPDQNPPPVATESNGVDQAVSTQKVDIAAATSPDVPTTAPTSVTEVVSVPDTQTVAAVVRARYEALRERVLSLMQPL